MRYDWCVRDFFNLATCLTISGVAHGGVGLHATTVVMKYGPGPLVVFLKVGTEGCGSRVSLISIGLGCDPDALGHQLDVCQAIHLSLLQAHIPNAALSKGCALHHGLGGALVSQRDPMWFLPLSPLRV